MKSRASGRRDTRGPSLAITSLSMMLRTAWRQQAGWRRTWTAPQVSTHTLRNISRLIVSFIPHYNWRLVNSNQVFHLLGFVFQIHLQFFLIFDTQHI